MSRTIRPVRYYFAMMIPPSGAVVILPGIINASIVSMGAPVSPVRNTRGEREAVVLLRPHDPSDDPSGAAENHRAQGVATATGKQVGKLFGPHLVLFHQFTNRDGSLSVPPLVRDCEGAGWDMVWVKSVDEMFKASGWEAKVAGA